MTPIQAPISHPDEPGAQRDDFRNQTRRNARRFLATAAYCMLLAGYLIFNRSFATLGFPPFYVGEMTLGFILLLALPDFKEIFIEPLNDSRAMLLIAFFAGYGALRVCGGVPTRGLDAARDGVICLYAVAAFLGPWLLSWSSRETANGAAAVNLRLLLVLVSPLAWMLAFCIVKGDIAAPRNIKVDFLTLSAAVAMCCWMYKSLEYLFRFQIIPFVHLMKILTSVLICILMGMTVFMLPTRALWPAPLVAGVVLLLAFGLTRTRALVCAGILLVCFVSAVWIVSCDPVAREKIIALVDPEDSHFKTPAGQYGAHSVKWRLVFWKHCIDETLNRAPLFGLGFGTNLTDLMRGTPDWPIFEDSQNATKYGSPNRHPHSAHVTVFTRLGFAGLLLWFAILAATFIQGVRNCRRARDEGWTARHWAETTILGVWSIYVLAMSFGVVLENPFGGIWFWTLTGVIVNRSEK